MVSCSYEYNGAIRFPLAPKIICRLRRSQFAAQQHVPPKRFVRVRHYGILSSRNKNRKITLCRNLLGCKKYLSRLKTLDAPAIIKLLYGKDVCKCSSCGGAIIRLPSDQYFIKPEPHILC